MNERQAKELRRTLHEVVQNRKELAKVRPLTSEVTKNLRSLAGGPSGEGNAKGSRLIGAGIALIAFPDPTISDLVGTGLVIAGVIRNRMQQPTIADVCKEFRKNNMRLANLKRELLMNTGI